MKQSINRSYSYRTGKTILSDANVHGSREYTRIADLKTLETEIDSAKSLSDLKTALASSNMMVSLIDHPVRKCGFSGHGRFGGMRNWRLFYSYRTVEGVSSSNLLYKLLLKIPIFYDFF